MFTAPDGMLRFPGGTVGEGENLLTGLCRDLHEETGIHDFKVPRELGIYSHYKLMSRKMWSGTIIFWNL